MRIALDLSISKSHRMKKANLSPLPPVARSNQFPYPNTQSEPKALSIQKACSKQNPLPIHPKLPSYPVSITGKTIILLESIPGSEFPKKTPPKGWGPSRRIQEIDGHGLPAHASSQPDFPSRDWSATHRKAFDLDNPSHEK
jgi:hypothetical protein